MRKISKKTAKNESISNKHGRYERKLDISLSIQFSKMTIAIL